MKSVEPNQLAATIHADIDDWASAILGRKTEILYKMGVALERHAKRLAPVDTGTLRASIHTVKIDNYTVEVRDGVHYGVYQEYGTSKMAAQPFMRPAIYSSENDRRAVMLEALK